MPTIPPPPTPSSLWTATTKDNTTHHHYPSTYHHHHHHHHNNCANPQWINLYPKMLLVCWWKIKNANIKCSKKTNSTKNTKQKLKNKSDCGKPSNQKRNVRLGKEGFTLTMPPPYPSANKYRPNHDPLWWMVFSTPIRPCPRFISCLTFTVTITLGWPNLSTPVWFFVRKRPNNWCSCG